MVVARVESIFSTDIEKRMHTYDSNKYVVLVKVRW